MVEPVTLDPPPLKAEVTYVNNSVLSLPWLKWFSALYLYVRSLQAANDPLAPAIQDAYAQLAKLAGDVNGLMLAPGVGQAPSVTPGNDPCCDLVDFLTLAPRNELGTMAALQQSNVPWLTFDETPQSVPPTVGTVAWDGGTTLGVQATSTVLIRVGESEYIYAKASAAITKGQVCYHTGAVGSSGVITAAPAPINLADPNQIVGVAAETIALNGFGLIQISGDLRGFNTTGSSVGEVWADGDALYYNPAYVGSFTKVKPSAPNQKTYMGEVTNAGSGGSGSIHVRIVQGTVLGGTDSNVQITSVANKDILQYDSALQYWKNIPLTSVAQPVAAPVVKTANFAVASTDVWLINNKSGSACTVTLPAAASNVGRVLYFQNYQAYTVVSDSSNVVPLVGGAAGTSILLDVAGDSATIVSDGTVWRMTQYVPYNTLLID